MTVLALNAGSSALKFGLFGDDGNELVAGAVEWQGGGGRPTATLRSPSRVSEPLPAGPDGLTGVVACLVRRLREIVPGGGGFPPGAVGRRVVHGWADFHEAVVIDGRVRDAVIRLAELAPLHNPVALECVSAVEEAFPGVPQVAVFDTALYARLPARAFLYPVPYEWYTDWGVCRFGFHGISHGYCLRRAADLSGRDPSALRLVSCHLGAGCSATAFRGGVPQATTMGFTTLDGLMMATRSGSIDPGISTYLQRSERVSAERFGDALEHRSGLLGVSGVSADYRRVEAALKGNERAEVALDMFADRIRSAVGGLAVTLGGLDALVFTGGVGEHSAALRAAVCNGLECLGVRLDSERNKACQPDCDVAAPDSSARVVVVRAREEQEIAYEARPFVYRPVGPGVLTDDLRTRGCQQRIQS